MLFRRLSSVFGVGCRSNKRKVADKRDVKNKNKGRGWMAICLLTKTKEETEMRQKARQSACGADSQGWRRTKGPKDLV